MGSIRPSFVKANVQGGYDQMNTLTGLVLLAGSSQSDTNIRYISGFCAPDPFLFLKTKSASVLVVSAMEKGRAEKQAKPGTEILTPAELGLSRRQSGKVENQIIKPKKKPPKHLSSFFYVLLQYRNALF